MSTIISANLFTYLWNCSLLAVKDEQFQLYPRIKHQFIIDILRKFEVCFDFSEYVGQRFLVPDLLAKEEPYTGEWEDKRIRGE